MTDRREDMARACFSANGNSMRREDAPEKLRDGWRAVADDVLLALPDPLDLAWDEAEFAVRDAGGATIAIQLPPAGSHEYHVEAPGATSLRLDGQVYGRGSTLDAALHMLAAKLRLAAQLREVER